MLSRIAEELRDRIASPRDDALTAIAHHEIDGVRLPEDIAQSITFLTTVGGIDTTTSLTGAALLHLAQHPADRERLIEDPDLLPIATEEFLRFYPPARAHKRIVAVDTVFGGRRDEAGRLCASERSGRRTRRVGVPGRRTSSSSTATRTVTSRSVSASTVARDHTWRGSCSPR